MRFFLHMNSIDFGMSHIWKKPPVTVVSCTMVSAKGLDNALFLAWLCGFSILIRKMIRRLTLLAEYSRIHCILSVHFIRDCIL